MRRSLAALGLILLSLVFLAPATSAQEAVESTITIHVAECPAGYAGDDYFTDCHDNRLPGVTLNWGVIAPGAPQPIVTDEDGVAVIQTAGASLGVSIVEVPPFDLALYAVYCSKNDGAEAVPVNYSPDFGRDEIGVTIPGMALTDGDQVVCDWYNIPAGSAPTEPTETPGAGDPTVSLPNTGSGNATGQQLPEQMVAGALIALGALILAVVFRRRSTI